MSALAKIGLVFIILVLSAPVLLYVAFVTGDLVPGTPRYDVFDDGEIFIEVMTQTAHGSEKGENVQYFALADGRRIRETAPFAPEPMTVYTVPDPSAVSVQQIRQNAGKKASLTTLGLKDKDGNSVPLTEDFTAILKQLDEIDHWIMTVRIIEVQGRLFVYTELNVNLWDPCALYQYDPDSRQLTELYTWNNKDPVGLRLPS